MSQTAGDLMQVGRVVGLQNKAGAKAEDKHFKADLQVQSVPMLVNVAGKPRPSDQWQSGRKSDRIPCSERRLDSAIHP